MKHDYQLPAFVVAAGGDGVFHIEDEDAVVVDLAVVKADGLIDLYAKFAAHTARVHTLSAVSSASCGGVGVSLDGGVSRPHADDLAVAVK